MHSPTLQIFVSRAPKMLHKSHCSSRHKQMLTEHWPDRLSTTLYSISVRVRGLAYIDHYCKGLKRIGKPDLVSFRLWALQ
jgi:hypothetical protein